MSPASFLTSCAIICLAIATSGLAEAAPRPNEFVAGWFEERGLPLPNLRQTPVCHGFGCTYHDRLSLSKSDLAELRQIMAAGGASPAAEREALARAEIWYSNRMTALLGHARHPGWYVEGAYTAGEMDCLDVATNTTALLVVLDELGFVRHHKIERPTARGVLIYGPHATAVIRDLSSGLDWAIDPWHNAPGTRADILPLDEWFAEVGGGHIAPPATAAAPAPRPHARHSARRHQPVTAVPRG